MLSSPPSPGRTLRALLSLVCLGVLCSAASCAAQSLSFGPGTNQAPWNPRALAFSTALAPVGGASGQFPFIAGGATSTGLIDPYVGLNATSYYNDVWTATDPQGTAWMLATAQAQWSARSSGGLIDVIIPGASVQILVLVGGRKAPGDSGLLNDVWSSVDLGVTWVPSDQSVINFTPRENFGLVIANGYDNPNTVYAYLVGGYGLQAGNVGAGAVPLNDVYYTRGRSTAAPWERLPFGNSPPFPGRYGFGIAPYNKGNGLVVAGGVIAGGVPFNQVWALDFGSQSWKPFDPLPSGPTGYVSLLLSSQFYYLFCGTDLVGNIANNVLYASVSDPELNWFQADASPPYEPPRLQFSTIFDTFESYGLVLAGTPAFRDASNLQDVATTFLQ